MKKKPTPINKYKEKDIEELREYLFGIVRDTGQATKDRNEASKQLLRLHKALQPERITEKPKEKPKKERELSQAEKKDIEELVNAS